MPFDSPPPEADEDPPSGSDFFIRHRRHPRRVRRSILAQVDARRRALTLAIVLLGAAISTPLAFIRCTGGFGLDLLYTWPAVLALSTPAVVLLRDLQRSEPPPTLAARLPTRARDGVRSRRRSSARSPHAARLSARRHGRVDRRA